VPSGTAVAITRFRPLTVERKLIRLVRVLAPLGLVSLVAAGLAAQIPTRRNPQTAAASTGPRLLVANPHSYASPDSSASVQIGDALRTRMDKLTGSDFTVITRVQINEALTTWGYPKDAVLPPPQQRSLASSLQARALLGSSLTKDASGRYTVTARLAGLNDEAGNVVTVSQTSGQSLLDLGTSLADKFGPVVKTWADAKGCLDQIKTAPVKALQSAQKAIQALPKHGLAHYCLAQLSLAKGSKNDSTEAQKHLQEAVGGDPLSLPAWTQLAAMYEVRGDTAKTVEALQQMLVIAPTNQPLREQAFRIFLKYSRPDAAEKAAEDGLRLDPTNADLWELLAGARVWRENYAGAIEAYEQSVANDSARADTTFYGKVITLAGQKPDTALLVKWLGLGLKKFPSNGTLLRQAVASYGQIGLTDSVLSLTGRLMQVDTTASLPALQAAQALQAAKRWKDAEPFIDFAIKHGDAGTKENGAGLLLNGKLQLLQPPTPDYQGAGAGLKQVLAVASPDGRYAPLANHFLGFSLLQQIVAADKEAETQKSCDAAHRVEQMTTEAEAAFGSAGGYARGADDRTKFLQYLNGLKPRTASMVRVYCK
jgi:tetratricopeptide (TPR) repeat protein